MRVLITGIAGFAGSHLAEFCLRQKGVEVWGFCRNKSPKDRIRHLLPRIQLRELDLRDGISVRQAVEECAPDQVFHLAGQSSVADSWERAADTFASNVTGTIFLLDALRHGRKEAAVLITGSCEEYGPVPEDRLPADEETSLRPVSPYAVSKIAEDFLGYQYFRSYGMRIVRVRPFPHIGPRQSDRLVASSLARQIAEMEAGKRPPILYLNDPEVRRDFTDVRDMVRAYWLALQRCEPGEVYVICSGRPVAIRDLVGILLRFSQVRPEIRHDPALRRPLDISLMYGNPARFRAATGWTPEIPLEKTLEDLLHYWRSQV